MINIKLTVAYDGGAYLGWQKTDKGPSIEDTLQKTLTKILQQEISLQAASRTDAGVHANGQIVNFLIEKNRFNSLIERLKVSLNKLLPKDIVILEIEEKPLSFHPTVDCLAKEYHYAYCYHYTQLPQSRHYAWHYYHDLNLEAMQKGANFLVGEHDFSAFCNARKLCDYEHHTRHLHFINIIQLPNMTLRFEIKGNNFLYKMVRNLVGTLVDIGCGKINPLDIPNILINKERPLIGITAPAHGLTLHKIYY